MIGDEGGEQDGAEGLAFLDRALLARSSASVSRRRQAVDAGAGVGRITKNVLLKRYDEVQLIEADEALSKRSRAYLGRKRTEGRCTFTCARVEELDVFSSHVGADIVWLQWTLQYLTDVDAVRALRALSGGLNGSGFLIVKENRPYGGARRDRFQLETPGANGRYDITRTDDHHRLLFQRAGLVVEMSEVGVETNSYVLVISAG